MEGLKANIYRFGDFELNCSARSVTCGGEPLTLKAKTFDLLQTLVENRGSVLSKDDLLERVWPGQFVEENNLTVQISALRKAFGNGRNGLIATIPGKGYSFVANVTLPGEEAEFVVENHEFSRIVVEETVEVSTNGKSNGAELYKQDVQVNPNLVGNRSRRRLAVGAFASLAILSALAIGFLFRDKLIDRKARASFAQPSVRQLTTNGKIGRAELSPDGRLFAYTVDDLGLKSLWLGYVDGGNHLLLREPTETSFRGLAFSPDGGHVYFSLRDDKNPAGALFKMPVLGGIQTKVLDEIGNFSLSPDGRQIAFTRFDREQKRDFVTIADLDGSARRDAASFSDDVRAYLGSVSWSPDGGRLALSKSKPGRAGIYGLSIIDLSSGGIEEIATDSLREVTKTAWTRDGNGVIVTGIDFSLHASVPQYHLWQVSLPSGELSPITSDRSQYGASWHNDAGASLSLSGDADALLTVEHRQLNNVWIAPSDDLGTSRQITNGSFGRYDGLWGLDWTPDAKLIYTTSDTQSQFLAQMNADGSGQKALSEPGNVDSQLTVSHDGRHILFHSNRTSEMDIWRCDVDGTNAKQLTFGGLAFHPAPSADGKWVYYKSRLDGIGGLYRVPIDGGESERIADKETSWISFSPDGKYFAASYITDKQRLAVFSAETNQIIREFDLPKTGTLYMGSRWMPDSGAVMYRDVRYGYWMQPVDGGPPRRVEGLPMEKLYNFSWSRDGKWLAYVRGQEIRDVIVLQRSDQ